MTICATLTCKVGTTCVLLISAIGILHLGHQLHSERRNTPKFPFASAQDPGRSASSSTHGANSTNVHPIIQRPSYQLSLANEFNRSTSVVFRNYVQVDTRVLHDVTKFSFQFPTRQVHCTQLNDNHPLHLLGAVAILRQPE